VVWVDDLADAFEAQWQQGDPPSIATFLGAASGERRQALLEELVEIDREYRRLAGEQRSLADYACESPELAGPNCAELVCMTDQTDHTQGECSRAPVPRRLGHFELVEVLGHGGFGTVFKARDEHLGRWVAIKVSRSGSFASVEERKRFLREARSAAELTHPNIVPVHSIAHDRDTPYIVSEFIDGPTLAEALERRQFEFRETAELVAQLAEALDHAHGRKIIHRDINPRNVLIDAPGRPHLTDFGLARRQEASVAVTLDGEVLGTPAYMAPEQAAGQKSQDGQS
jgi:serine/threonine-protein kinase